MQYRDSTIYASNAATITLMANDSTDLAVTVAAATLLWLMVLFSLVSTSHGYSTATPTIASADIITASASDTATALVTPAAALLQCQHQLHHPPQG